MLHGPRPPRDQLKSGTSGLAVPMDGEGLRSRIGATLGGPQPYVSGLVNDHRPPVLILGSGVRPRAWSVLASSQGRGTSQLPQRQPGEHQG